MKKLLSFIVVFLLINIVNISYVLASETLLYDVNFSSPPHIVGEPPAVGTTAAPREIPTKIVFGTPRIVENWGLLTDQPCRLSGVGSGAYDYTQLEFGINDAQGFSQLFDRYIIEMDIFIELLRRDLIIHLDTPQVRNLHFEPNGNMYIFIPSGYFGSIGTYEKGIPFRLKMDINLKGQAWSIIKDGSELITADLLTNKLEHFRLNLAGSTHSSVAIDNIVVYGISNGEEINMRDSGALLSLHNEVFRSDVNNVRFLIDSGVNVNTIGEEGKTPLHIAVEEGDEEIVLLLIEKGANLEARDNL